MYEEYMYVINRMGREWRSITTLDDATHNHPVDTAEIKAHKIKSRLKTKAQETAQPLPALYSQEVSQIVTDPNPDDV